MVGRCCQKEGLVQTYASSHFPSSMHKTRVNWFCFGRNKLSLFKVSVKILNSFFLQHGVFTELCNHDSCVCSCEPYIGNLNLVCPWPESFMQSTFALTCSVLYWHIRSNIDFSISYGFLVLG